jgi:hypothetical protein
MMCHCVRTSHHDTAKTTVHAHIKALLYISQTLINGVSFLFLPFQLHGVYC